MENKLRDELKKLLLAKYLWTDLVCEELLNEIMPILQQEWIRMLGEELPLSKAQAAYYASQGRMSNEYDKYNQAKGANKFRADMHSKIEKMV